MRKYCQKFTSERCIVKNEVCLTGPEVYKVSRAKESSFFEQIAYFIGDNKTYPN